MKRKLILMCAAGTLVMATMIGGTLADFNTSTGNKGISNITVKELGIGMKSKTASEQIGQNGSDDIAVVPGGEVEVSHSIVNDVPEGYELYTRVTIDKKWKSDALDSSKIHLYAQDTELVAGATVNGWIVWYADEEQVVMYYTKPLKAGEETANLIDTVKFDADMGNAYVGAKIELDFSADAVQRIAAEDSIPSEWGVYPEIEADGTIRAINE